MKMITKLFGRIYVIKFFFAVLIKLQALCLVEHINIKKPPTLFFQPRPTPPIINNYYNVQPHLLFQPLLFGTRELK